MENFVFLISVKICSYFVKNISINYTLELLYEYGGCNKTNEFYARVYSLVFQN